MNALEKAIEEAIATQGDNVKANKAYLEFIKANFIIPVEKNPQSEEPEVLYLIENNQAFLPAFTNMNYFDAWANEIGEQVNLLKLSGVDLLKGIGDETVVCLNVGSSIYKEFNPAELARMKNMVLKLFRT